MSFRKWPVGRPAIFTGEVEVERGGKRKTESSRRLSIICLRSRDEEMFKTDDPETYAG